MTPDALPLHRSLIRSVCLQTALTVCSLLTGSRALAAGFELTPPGARDLGRAGASVAGADSALGVFYNPATVLAGQARYEAEAALHVNLSHTCYRHSEVDAAGDTATSPKICGSKDAALIPQLALSTRFGSQQRFAVTLGLQATGNGTRDVNYGNPTTGRTSSAADAPLSPSRYLLLQEKLLQVFPTLSFAYQPHARVRVGASFGWGITSFDFSLAAFSRTIVLQQSFLNPTVGATSDVSTRVEGTDAFTPRFSLGAWGKPLENVPLELGLAFTWTGDVEVTGTKLHVKGLQTSYYPSSLIGPGTLLGEIGQPTIDGSVSGVGVHVPSNAQLAGGIRYAMKLPNAEGPVGDRLATERFDIELDAVGLFNQRFDAMRVKVPSGSTIFVPSPSPVTNDINLVLPERITLYQRWQNQLQLRLGGDVTVLPNRLALRAGASYESHGAKKGYEQLAFTPFARYGLYAGATVRIVRWVDVSAGYALFFTPSIKLSTGDAKVRRIISGQTQDGDDTIVNAGKYTQKAQGLAVQLSGRF